MTNTLLNRVGKGCFLDCFSDFEAASSGSGNLEDLMDVMYHRGGAETENSARTKARNGLKIFQLGLVPEALTNISQSKRLESSQIETALKLLQQFQ